jgi:integrase
MATITKRPDYTVVCGITSAGQRVRKRFSPERYGAGYQKLAEELYRQLLFDNSGIIKTDVGEKAKRMRSLTVAELADRYRDEHLCNTRAWSNRSYLEIIKGKWGEHRIAHINIGVVRPWIYSLLNAPEAERYSGYTVRKIVRYFYRVFSWALEMEIVDRNPLQGLLDMGLKKSLKRACPHRRVTLTPEQFFAFLVVQRSPRGVVHGLPTWFVRAVSASWYTGMRCDEVCAVRWSWIHDGAIHVPAASDKEARAKTVVLGDRGMALVREIQAEQAIGTASEFVFTGESGAKLTGNVFGKAFGRYARDAARMLPYMSGVRLHDLRHCYEQRKRREGVSSKVIRAQLGHSSPAMDDVYDDVTIEDRRLALSDAD